MSTHSSLTSVFHDLLGDRKAKEVAAQEALVTATRSAGAPFISQQSRETVRGEFKRFSIMYYRRLSEGDALDALRSWSSDDSEGLEIRLAAAMHARVPIWHVVVESVDYPGRQITLQKYFMQNMEELKDLVRAVLVEFLNDDAPEDLEQAADNPQFQAWCKQWYHQSEDLDDDRSARYICRLPGCGVLRHCISNDFSECCRLLLDRFSDVTASERWLVLAEPMRYHGGYQNNAFHEAAYCGAFSCLEVLIAYGNQHGLDWKRAVDSNGETVLDIAKSRAERGKEGAKECVCRLQREYGEEVGSEIGDPDTELMLESILVMDVNVEGFSRPEVLNRRRRFPLPSESVCWADLVLATREAVRQVPQGATVSVIVCKATVEDSDEQAVNEFFELWSCATSLGFNDCRLIGEGVTLQVSRAIVDRLESPQPPAWRRLYVFEACGPLFVADRHGGNGGAAAAAAAALAATLRRLCRVLALNPLLPLWRLDHVRARALPQEERHLRQLMGAALDVKQCVHQLREDQPLYHFFWSRLIHVERRQLDRLRLLSDMDCDLARHALDPMAASYLKDCASLWATSLCGGDTGNTDFLVERGVLTVQQHAALLAEIDSALAAALLMSETLPTLPSSLREVLPPQLLEKLHATPQILSSDDCQSSALRALNTPHAHGQGATGLSKGLSQGKGLSTGKGTKGSQGKGTRGSKGKGKGGGASPYASPSGSGNASQRLAPTWRQSQP